jgi:hypothetical protein
LAHFPWKISQEAKAGLRAPSQGACSGAGRAQLRDKRTFAPPGLEDRALLHHFLEHGDIVRRDAAGRTIIKLAVNH